MKKAILISLGFAGLAIAACKKDSAKKAPPSTMALLTSVTWKYDTVSLDLDKNGVPETSLPPGSLQPCQLDNTITFKSDKTGMEDEGATKCNDSLPQTTSFTWSLSNGDSTLNIQGNSDQQLNGPITIKEISDSTLVLMKHITIANVITIDANLFVKLKK